MLRLRTKRFALLQTSKTGQFARLVSAVPGTQRLMSAAASSDDLVTFANQEEVETSRQDGEPTLERERFRKFLEIMKARLDLTPHVAWEEGGAPLGRARTHTQLVDMTEKGAGGAAGRRMFVQVEVDATARADQAWRLEFRWFMCRGTKVEDFITSTIRQANKAGLLLLQIPTGRRPRPFSPPLTVRVAEPLRHAASLALRRQLGFVREGYGEAGERMMHELGVAFASEDASGFLWTVNRLQPSEHASAHARLLLERFRAITDALELAARGTGGGGGGAGGRRRGGCVGGGGAGAGGERRGGAPAEDSGGADVGINDVGLEPKRGARSGRGDWASMDGPGPVRLASVATDGRRPSAPVVARPAPVREADDGDGTRGEAPAAAWTASSTAEEEAWTMSRSRSNTVGYKSKLTKGSRVLEYSRLEYSEGS